MTAALDDPASRSWAYLSRVAEPPCAELVALVQCVGPVEAAERVRRGVVDDDLLRHTEARREIDRAADDLELLARRGGRLITPDDDEWPMLAFAAFGGVGARPRGGPPMVLWALGPARLDDAAQRAAALVGTRAASAYGEHVAADLASGLVERDVAVVSGGAYGIDGAAHRAALACDGITVAVLAGGLDIPYPAGHSALLHRVAQHGLLFTEYPPNGRQRHRSEGIFGVRVSPPVIVYSSEMARRKQPGPRGRRPPGGAAPGAYSCPWSWMAARARAGRRRSWPTGPRRR